jgi:metal-responsive CopG/Arc/MetJ family transcriptional regulator
METIQVVIDKKLLSAADRLVRKTKTNRSALIREALREHLRRAHVRALEEEERRAYEALPQDMEAVELWEAEAVWPPE